MNPDDNPFVIPESDEPLSGPSASTVPPPFPNAAARPRPHMIPPREPICGGCARQKEPRVFIPFLKKSMTVALILPLAILLFFFVFGLLLSGMKVISTMSMGDMGAEIDNPDVTEKILAGDDLLPHKIAVLPIEGIITENEDGFIRQAIRTAYEDADIDALVLRVNSPGGTMTGSDYYYTLLKQLKEERSIPVIVSMGPVAASGGYYVSMVGDKIFAERSSVTGSIGVICEIPNASGLCEKIGVTMNNITSGPHKAMGDFTQPMADDERAIWQALVNESYRQFLEVVRAGRPNLGKKGNSAPEETSSETDAQEAVGEEDDDFFGAEEESTAASGPAGDSLEAIADGRVYTAPQALELGLIDEIGFLDDAIEAAESAAGIPHEKTEVVRYTKKEPLFKSLLGEGEVRFLPGRGSKADALVDAFATPTVYCLMPGALPIESGPAR